MAVFNLITVSVISSYILTYQLIFPELVDLIQEEVVSSSSSSFPQYLNIIVLVYDRRVCVNALNAKSFACCVLS